MGSSVIDVAFRSVQILSITSETGGLMAFTIKSFLGPLFKTQPYLHEASQPEQHKGNERFPLESYAIY